MWRQFPARVSSIPGFIPKNLNPKTNLNSPISLPIRKEMESVIKNPPIISSMVLGDSFSVPNQTQKTGQTDICHYNYVDTETLREGLYNFQGAKDRWGQFSLHDRLDIFLEAANLLEHKYYDKMMAYTILGQNKTPFEAELDAICELVDFLRFNVNYVYQIQRKQPISNIRQDYGSQKMLVLNSSEYLPLNGFVASITPFNFTAIGGNLALTPLMLGNSVFWKPSDNAILSNYLIYQIMVEAGLPPDILNFVPQDPEVFGKLVMGNQNLGGLLFTGSSQVFDRIYENIGQNISKYYSYPRIIGETGGKNYHFVHPSFDNIDYLVDKTFESAFGYSGQKCSACSRLYLPDFMWEEFQNKMEVRIQEYLKIHRDNYGLINEKSFQKIRGVLERIKQVSEMEVIRGGELVAEDRQFFMEPTIVRSNSHHSFLFQEEFFAPLLGVYTYPSHDVKLAVKLCEGASRYALTGSIFTMDFQFLDFFTEEMKYTCGNYYINDKSTGSVVGQQPFGGSGKSGTNDKAGDINMIYRLCNQKNIKECVKIRD